MSGSDNKIKYNIKNVHAAKQTETEGENGTVYGYETPRRIPGAVSISLDAEGEISTFYADGIAYYVASANNGYSGDLEMALIPSWFRTEILNELQDANGVLAENANNNTNKFALLFEFDGDVKAIRRCLYNCTCTRPSIESETKEETIEPGTETLSITNSPRSDGMVKVQTGPDTEDNTYSNWYKEVYVPQVEESAPVEPMETGE
jgi:phi13 family phage major tail protein